MLRSVVVVVKTIFSVRGVVGFLMFAPIKKLVHVMFKFYSSTRNQIEVAKRSKFVCLKRYTLTCLFNLTIGKFLVYNWTQ